MKLCVYFAFLVLPVLTKGLQSSRSTVKDIFQPVGPKLCRELCLSYGQCHAPMFVEKTLTCYVGRYTNVSDGVLLHGQEKNSGKPVRLIKSRLKGVVAVPVMMPSTDEVRIKDKSRVCRSSAVTAVPTLEDTMATASSKTDDSERPTHSVFIPNWQYGFQVYNINMKKTKKYRTMKVYQALYNEAKARLYVSLKAKPAGFCFTDKGEDYRFKSIRTYKTGRVDNFGMDFGVHMIFFVGRNITAFKDGSFLYKMPELHRSYPISLYRFDYDTVPGPIAVDSKQK